MPDHIHVRGGVIGTARSSPDAGDAPVQLGTDVGFLLARAGGRAIKDLNRALEPFGLRSRHYSVLVASAGRGGLSQRRLGSLLGVDPSAVVALVDDLERAGLVRRDADRQDRRTRLIVTTDRGRALLEQVAVPAAKVEDRLLEALDGDERRLLAELLRRITIMEVT
jgi:DNA-binding MarR family transcriptional regulator